MLNKYIKLKRLFGKTIKRKCSLCQHTFKSGEDFDGDLDSILDTGRCIDCYEEYGDNYPDRL